MENKIEQSNEPIEMTEEEIEAVQGGATLISPALLSSLRTSLSTIQILNNRGLLGSIVSWAA